MAGGCGVRRRPVKWAVGLTPQARLEHPEHADAERPDAEHQAETDPLIGEQPGREPLEPADPGELEAASSLSLTELQTALGPGGLDLLRRHRLLRPLIKEMVQERVLQAVPVSDDDRQRVLQEHCRRRGIADIQTLVATAERNGVGRADLEWNLLLPLRRVRHCRQHFSERAETTFLRNKNDLDQVVYSLLRLQDPHLAFELYQRIDTGEADFAELAPRFSEGPERHTRGVVGPKPLTSAHPTLAERLRIAQPGVVQEPIVVQGRSLVVRLERLLPATFDDSMAQRICDQLFDQWLDEQVNAILSGIQKDA